MSRTVTTYTSTEIVKPVTRPKYCIQIDWNQDILGVDRYCTSGETDWNGELWYYRSLEVTDLSISPEESKATIDYVDPDQSFRAKVLTAKLLDVTLDIWKLYGLGPYDPDDGEHLFSGKVNSVKGRSGDLIVQMQATGQTQTTAPRAWYGPPLMNHIPRPDTTVLVGSVRIRIN